MKKYQLGNEYSKEALEIAKKHLKMIGKDASAKESAELLDVLVRANKNFPYNEQIEEIMDAFFSAIHYGSHELKNATLLAHTRSFGEWIKNRSTIMPVSNEQDKSGKPEDWKYNPNEQLPKEIDRQKAKELLKIIHDVYGSDTQRVLNSNNFMDYIEKLKARYYE
jgi:hypothetical protein